MPDDLIDRERILAADDPREVFGDAMTDPRELRRAYAKLARQFRSDEAASSQIRTLYERARVVADNPDDGDAPAEPTEGPTTALSPARRLHQALTSGNHQDLVVLLRNHGSQIVAEAPGLLVPVLQSLVFGIGEHLDPFEVDFLHAFVCRPDLGLEPDLADALERATLVLQHVAFAEADDAVPKTVTNALRATWFQSPPHVAEVWLRTAQAMETEGIDLRATLAYLERHHPAVLGLWSRTEERMMAQSGPPAKVDLIPLRNTYRPSRPTPRTGLLVSVPVAVISLVAVIALAMGAAFVAGFSAARLVLVVAVVFAVSVYFGARHESFATVLERQDLPVEPLLAFARDHGLWPRELAALVAPERPLAFDEEAFAYLPGHPLLRLAQDPSAVLSCMTQAHVDRILEEPRE